jgi:phospholipase C
LGNVDASLDKVEHVVVLMLENRSFDHMLGYLSLGGGHADVDGLAAGMANEWGGRSYPIHHLNRTAFEPVEDPEHSGHATEQQIAGGAMSLAEQAAAHRAERALGARELRRRGLPPGQP